jgi:hypothetical protein
MKPAVGSSITRGFIKVVAVVGASLDAAPEDGAEDDPTGAIAPPGDGATMPTEIMLKSFFQKIQASTHILIIPFKYTINHAS